MKYAIQGVEGSFHQLALQTYIGKSVSTSELIMCKTFRELVAEVEKSTQQDRIQGVMAIENTSVGSLLPNYNLLQQSDLAIVGEVYIHVEMHLMANKNVSMDEITEVHSHPIALQQCIGYLSQHKWKLVETEDTALSAKHIYTKKMKHVACVANKLAASLYQLQILDEGVNDFKKNYTRFLVLEKKHLASSAEDANKASIQFLVANTRGSLAKVLNEIDIAGINLSKLQSFAMPDTHFRYYFHADMEFNDIQQFHKAIQNIKPLSENLVVHGIYRNGLR